MSSWSIPPASYRVQQLFANLPSNRQYDVFILTQLLSEIVERDLATVIDNTKEPFEYHFHWKQRKIKVNFKLSPQTKTPLIIDLVL